MDIYLHNTYSGELEKFQPLEPGKVGMYHCGPTVYGKTHIGHARPYIFADVLRRLFEYNQYQVTQIINITDVGHLTDDGDAGDDKIEKYAREAKLRAQDVTNLYTEDFFKTLDALNILRAKISFPKATEHIQEQIDMITELEQKGATYKTSDGIYFDTSTFSAYGELGNIDLEHLKEGARIGVNTEKKNPSDFALWKFSDSSFSKPDEKRQQEWDSPWGVGFPGWHIECSAMSRKYLGETFDIHTGGIDHIPVHHNNEIAQSETVTGKPQANIWMHVNHILINGEKISKSLKNSLYLEDLELRDISPLAYRYWILTADYKTLMNFTWDAVLGAKTAFEKLVMQLAKLPDGGTVHPAYHKQLTQLVSDDMGTPRAIAKTWELLKDQSVTPADKKATIFDIDQILGLNLEAISFLASDIQVEVPAHVQKLVTEREQARKANNYTKADALREMIQEAGFDVLDTPDGTSVIAQ
jgi:cysteinyl-tRNA synthetase